MNLRTRHAVADAETPRVGPCTVRLWIERMLNGITQGVLTVLDLFAR